MKRSFIRFLYRAAMICTLAQFAVSVPGQPPAHGYAAKGALSFPKPVGHVNDFAGQLSPAVKQQLESEIVAFTSRSEIDFAVVTMNAANLNGRPIEEYARALGNQWGVGRGPKKLGVLLLIAIGPRGKDDQYHGATRLEVSRNLEPYLSNEQAAQLIRPMREDFQAGRFDQAATYGAQAVMRALAEKLHIALGDTNAAPTRPPRPGPDQASAPSSDWGWLLALPVIFVPLALVTLGIFLVVRVFKGFGGGRSWQPDYSPGPAARFHSSPSWHNPTSAAFIHQDVSSWNGTDSSWSNNDSSTGSSWASTASSTSDSWTSSDTSSSSSDFGSSSGGDFGGGGSSDSW